MKFGCLPRRKERTLLNERWRDRAKIFDLSIQFLLHFYLFSAISRGERHSLEKPNAGTRTPLFPHGHELTLPPVLPGKPLIPGEPAGPG